MRKDGQTEMTKLTVAFLKFWDRVSIHSAVSRCTIKLLNILFIRKMKSSQMLLRINRLNSYRRFEEYLCLRLQGVLRTEHEGTTPFRRVGK